jgi:hypothetical protein
MSKINEINSFRSFSSNDSPVPPVVFFILKPIAADWTVYGTFLPGSPSRDFAQFWLFFHNQRGRAEQNSTAVSSAQ